MNRYWVGGSGNWNLSNTANWSASSGGAGGASVPTSSDDVFFDANSGSGIVDLPNTTVVPCRNIDTTGYTGTIRLFNSSTSVLEVYGSLIFTPTFTFNAQNGTVRFAATDNNGGAGYSIQSSGQIFRLIQFSGVGGKWSLQDAFNVIGSITQTNGELVTNGYSVTSSTYVKSGTNTMVLNMTNTTWTLVNTSGSIWNVGSMTNFTLVSTGSTIYVGAATGNTRTIAGGGGRYGILDYTIDKSVGTLAITGSNVFKKIDMAPGGTLQFASGATTTTDELELIGEQRSWIYIPGGTSNVSTPDSAAVSTVGDIDYRVRLALDSYSAANLRLASKSGQSPNLSWVFRSNSRTLSLELSTNGTSLATGASATTTFADPGDGVAMWLRFTRRASDGRVQFFSGTTNTNDPSAVSWTQVGSDRTGVTGSLFDSAGDLYIDGLGGGGQWQGKLYRAQLRNNVNDDGTGIVFDADLSTKAWGANSFTESSSNAATVSITAQQTQVGDGRIRAQASSAGVLSTIKINNPSDIVNTYVDIQDIRIGSPYKFFVTSPYIDSGNNINIIFNAPTDTPTIRQSNFINNASATSGSITFDEPTTAGRLLVLMVGFAANPGTFTPPSGWTLANDNTGANANVFMYYKIANGSETTVSASWVNSVSSQFFVYEIGNFDGVPTLDTIDDNSSASATSLSTGSGVTPTAVPAVAIVAIAANGGMGASGAVPTNNFQEDYNTLQTTSSFLKVALKPLAAIASQSTTLSWSTARVPLSVIAIFKDVGSAASTTNFLLFM